MALFYVAVTLMEQLKSRTAMESRDRILTNFNAR